MVETLTAKFVSCCPVCRLNINPGETIMLFGEEL
jgi:hypothetical protein